MGSDDVIGLSVFLSLSALDAPFAWTSEKRYISYIIEFFIYWNLPLLDRDLRMLKEVYSVPMNNKVRFLGAV